MVVTSSSMVPVASTSRHGQDSVLERVEAARTFALASIRDEDEVDRALTRQQEQHKLLSNEVSIRRGTVQETSAVSSC